ncbi:shikimate dehydrogenase [Streptococcus pseudoporcinus]|uniref:Shikimate 5-dehydrogenase n=1 Tax=Streptococcus pseudoporcinus TaxID=361101 RepID=A0A4U9XMX9_9STRE|nr:shikimate dehydrogenase [Streptococcus pseudoporcinus]VTS14038.1 shikimate 5-dehydrogenase [Streptococcus pseudoporcinus]VUC66962.1 shikimate 5-dehydrogenase [Streptococcus pseudoporcinus]VUC97890.1 shikimate 5-dehydrogenase [Streptococcus pseudoporcinus]VUC98282.1 shikimate 5-dehydrogenase [Streptococcus pseudoporcinus]
MTYSALIGNPVEHSISDYLFEYLNANIGGLKDYKHQKILVESASLADKMNSLIKDPQCIGVNITLPYKREVLQYVNHLDKSIKVIGSVNNIYKRGSCATGTNTDWKGIYETLVFFGINKLEKCCILGTGGTCRAAIFALQQLNVLPVIVYREPLSENTLCLMEDYPYLHYVSYQEMPNQLTEIDLIINTTPVGMITNDDQLPIGLEMLDSINFCDKSFLDVVFNPLHTKLYRYFKHKGAKTIDGLWVMIFQGIAAYSLWTNKRNEEHNLSKDELVRLHRYIGGKLKTR